MSNTNPIEPWQNRTRRVQAKQMVDDVRFAICILNADPPTYEWWIVRLDDNNTNSL